MKKAYISKINGDLNGKMLAALNWIGWQKIIDTGARVFIKPNFTYPCYKPGVTTSPQVLEALINVISARTKRIMVGESDGGDNAWTAEQAFAGHDLYQLQKTYGFGLVNLSKQETRAASFSVAGKSRQIKLPKLLLDETDVFITVPLPKVHIMVGFTGAIKNQWGCIPDTMRLFHHSVYNEMVLGINKLLKPQIVVFDGQYMLNRSGPMFGDVEKMDLLIAAGDLGVADLVASKVMQLNPTKIKYFRLAMQEGIMPKNLDGVELNEDISKFQTKKFYLRRTWHNYGAMVLFHCNLANRIFYSSFMAKPLHWINSMIKDKKNKINHSSEQ